MEYTLNLGAWNSVFAVPCALVDQHLKLAGALQLKVLLWCLRHAGEPVSAEKIAQSLSSSPADVRDAMSYWLESGILAERNGDLSPAPLDAENHSQAGAASAAPAVPAHPQEQSGAETAGDPAPVHHVRRRLPKPDGLFIAERISHSDEVRYMMEEAQQILGRPLSPGLSSTLLMLHDDCGLPGDVILMLLQYTKSRGRDTTNYIETVGLRWADEGINTHELVEEKLRALDERAAAWRTLAQILGISKRSPSPNEEQTAYRWIKEWAFPEDMIREAYNRCVDSTGKISLKYMGKILERWQKNHITTLEQAQAELEEKAKSDRQQKHQATYDISEYERMSLDVPEEA